MPWVDKQAYPYASVERVWEPGWDDVELTPYGGKTRVYESAPGEYHIPVYGRDWAGNRTDTVERFIDL